MAEESSSQRAPGMRIVFLDIDGVLNNSTYLRKHGVDGWEPNGLDPKNIAALNELLAWTQAKVVVSSSWRLVTPLTELRRLLNIQGFDGDILDRTPEIVNGLRGEEIQTWLDITSFTIESFVILDDDSDMGELMPYLVRTTFSRGLTSEDVTRAARILLA